VIAADTVVVLDGEALGKPGTPEVAVAMLSRLSGRTHHVVTGVAVAGPAGAVSTTVTTEVTWRPLSVDEIDAYVATGEPLDKAGGYGIQGGGEDFVTSLVGSRDNVVGLPVATALELMATVEIANNPWRR
jgi:septum formation protein